MIKSCQWMAVIPVESTYCLTSVWRCVCSVWRGMMRRGRRCCRGGSGSSASMDGLLTTGLEPFSGSEVMLEAFC